MLSKARRYVCNRVRFAPPKLPGSEREAGSGWPNIPAAAL